MKIKKLYEFTHRRQLWRIIPGDRGKLVIEERDTLRKEAYFSCLETETGKKIFENFQPDEKFWIGVETVYRDMIFFHKYLKPDMPAHKGIIAYDINSGLVIWQNMDFNFLFILDEKLYCYKILFEGKKFFILDFLTGEVTKELGNDTSEINRARQIVSGEKKEDDYLFPEDFNEEEIAGTGLQKKFSQGNYIEGRIKAVRYGESIFLHALENPGSGIRNVFKAVEISSGKVLLSEVIGRNNEKFLPEAFFLKGNLLFLLKEKDTLVVYSIKQ